MILYWGTGPEPENLAAGFAAPKTYRAISYLRANPLHLLPREPEDGLHTHTASVQARKLLLLLVVKAPFF